jgi:hypothetical protein
VQPVSIHRKNNLVCARALAEYCRLKLRAPPSAVTDQVIEQLADMLAEARIWRQNEMARFRSEFEAEATAKRDEMIATCQAFMVATLKALDVALAMRRKRA